MEEIILLSRVRGSVTNNNGLWIKWLGLLALLLQLQSMITARNRWLCKTRSIPCWTKSVFSYTVTNDQRTIPSGWTEWRATTHLRTNPLLRVLTCPPVITSKKRTKTTTSNSKLSFCLIRYHKNMATLWLSPAYPLERKRVLASSCLATDCRSGSTIPTSSRWLLNRCLAMVILVTILLSRVTRHEV
jgi:hypothetical protein